MILCINTGIHRIALLLACVLACTNALYSDEQPQKSESHQVLDIDSNLEENPLESDDAIALSSEPHRINDIIIIGNKFVPIAAILNRIPYIKGEIFDPSKTRTLINNLYYDLKRFRNVSMFVKRIGNKLVNLYIKLEEKAPLKEVIFEGNKQVTEKEIKEKINFAEVPAIEPEELKRYALAIQKIYRDKGYNRTEIVTRMDVDTDGKATGTFIITEYPKAIVKRILFKGNNHITSKELRNIIFTREDWLLSIMDKAGTFQQERLEGDKHVIEQHYQNHGYINAKVVDIDVAIDPVSQYTTITYEIFEGDCYTVSSVKAPGNDILKDDYLADALPIRPGDIYSREKIVDSIRALEFIWGDFGYAYANIEPSIQPDDENRTVSIAFYSELGKPVILNKLTIRGNIKTRDKIIRRKISFEEGCLITTRQMELSKNRIESLGYFDQRDGVNWKMTRLSDDLADLDLYVKEVKTGSAHLQLGFGGSASSLADLANSVSVEGTVSDTNLFGSGIKMNLTGRLGADEKTVLFNITQPWMFDKPIYSALDLYHKRLSYDELRLTRPVNEKYTGGSLTAGFVTGSKHYFFQETFVRCLLGIDNVSYESTQGNRPCATPVANFGELDSEEETLRARAAYNFILAKEFNPGAFVTVSVQTGKDAKNHPLHPTRGYTWLGKTQVSLSALDSCIGFCKTDLDFNWYTPLIGDFDLIFRIHGYVGIVTPFKNKIVPYRELFHIGGPASVRGFLFGQIGPQFCVTKNETQICDSIGGNKAFFVNMELIFPITPNFSMKGVLFYDGGAGWDNPYAPCVDQRFTCNTSFNYRHAVGVGIRMLNPMPLKVDWGFKLDPRKGEPISEVHFGMSYDW